MKNDLEYLPYNGEYSRSFFYEILSTSQKFFKAYKTV